jgi:hypothetical protein
MPIRWGPSLLWPRSVVKVDLDETVNFQRKNAQFRQDQQNEADSKVWERPWIMPCGG